MIRLFPSHLLNSHDSLMWKSLLFIWRMRKLGCIQKRESPFPKHGAGARGGERESKITLLELQEAPRAAWVGSARLVSGGGMGGDTSQGV